MKKSFLIAFSLLVAVAVFAFTTAANGKRVKNPDPELYWYVVTYDGNTPMIEYQVPEGPITIGQVNNCSGSGRLCKSGFLEELEFNQDNDPILTDVEGYQHLEKNPPPTPAP